MIPANESFRSNNLSGIDIKARLQLESKFPVSQTIQNLRHQDLFMFRSACGHCWIRYRECRCLGQTIQQLCDLVKFSALPVECLFLYRRDNVFMKRINK